MSWLFLALGWAKTAVTALFRVLAAYPWQAAVIALLCLSGWLWRDGAQWKFAYQNEHKAYGIFRAKVIDNTKEYTARAIAAKKKTEADNARKAQIADQNYNALLQRFRDSVRAQANRGSPGGDNLSRASSSTGLPEIATGPTEFLISTDDALKCADLGAYAQSAYEWAQSVSP